MKILCLSDEVVSLLYSPRVRELFNDIDLVISCGDLPLDYLEFVVNRIDKALYYVEGNHMHGQQQEIARKMQERVGGTDLHCKLSNYQGILMAGVAGCLKYSRGPYQYTQAEMFMHVLHLIPGLLRNRILYGRYLDLFITHAPPWGIHDQNDLPHQGIKSFRWLDRVFQPRFHLHGHIHYYRPDAITETTLGRTRVINVYRYRQVEF